MPIIKLDNVKKTYGKKTILNDISMDINEEELVAITGKSGTGKSTLLNIIGLLETVDCGKVIIDGEENINPNSYKSSKILRDKISYLFQNFALIDDETVKYNLEIALKYINGNKKSKEEKIKEVLSKVGLEGYEKRKIYELSGGEQQRIAIARIMLKKSKIILADEPTGSLDEDNRDIIIKLLQQLNEEGKTIIIVTHDKIVAESCKRIINL